MPLYRSAAAVVCALALSSDVRAAPFRALHSNGSSASSAGDPNGENASLQKQIDALLSVGPITTGQVTIEVRSLSDGRLIYARNPNLEVNPASNTKVATSAAALFRLGPEFRYTTDILADHAAAHGKAKALYVKGRGDPTITTDRLDAFARDLVHRGITQIGDLVLDDTQFDNEPWGPGWETETSDKAYASGVSALSLNRNSVGIYVLPGERPGQKAHVALEPEAHGFFELVNSVITAKANQHKRAVPHTYAAGERTRVTVSGRIPLGGDPIILYRRVTNPTMYFGHSFAQILQQHGVHMSGVVRRGTVPADAKFVTSYDSPELGEIVRDMNKASSNFMAEMLLKTMGAELQGAPGTWPKGVAAMEDALAELGLARGTYQLRNGSGLNDANRFSAHQMVALLSTLYSRFPLAAEFVASLPVAARDGSLRLRMDGTEAAGRLRAKTGTLDRAVALSGFLQSVSGEPFVFSMMVNDWNGKVSPIQLDTDKFGALLASVGERPAERQAQLAQTVALELSPAEQQSRISTYAKLAEAHDKKNLSMLRSAVRTERDPLVRLMIADALFRTDAESGSGPLLEALPVGSELFNRLRATCAELKLPIPVLGSLLDLAADGNADALARIFALAPAARSGSDVVLELALADGLADVGEAAPDETLAALRSAPAAEADAVAELIGAGFSSGNVEMDESAFAQVILAASARAQPDAADARHWVQLIERRGARVAVAAPRPPPPPAAATPASAAPAAPTSQSAALAPATPAPPATPSAPIAPATPAPAATPSPPIAPANSASPAAPAPAPVAIPPTSPESDPAKAANNSGQPGHAPL